VCLYFVHVVYKLLKLVKCLFLFLLPDFIYKLFSLVFFHCTVILYATNCGEIKVFMYTGTNLFTVSGSEKNKRKRKKKIKQAAKVMTKNLVN